MTNPATQFKKDDPKINREGRPKGAKSFTTKVREALEVMFEIKDKEGKTLTYEQLLAKKMVSDAIKNGDTALRRLIWNYLDGMPEQEHKFSGDGDKPILVKFIDGTTKDNRNTD